jgi:hypothetical protein
LGFAQAVTYCCSGTYIPNNPSQSSYNRIECPDDANTRCLIDFPTGSSNASSIRALGCGDNSTDESRGCDTDNCNCPTDTDRDPDNYFETNATPDYMASKFGDLKKIMYPVMGVVFGVIWVILAFLGLRLPLDLLLLLVGLIDAIFGIFLIFIPITTFLGLFYIAVGAFTIAICRHTWGGDTGIDFLLALTTIVFLLTGGLTFVAYDWGYGKDYVVTRISGYIPLCDRDMNIDNDDSNLSTRCGNYALFVTFSVYLLFLVQPIAMIAAAFKRVGRHHDTTVVVNEKHTKPENKNTV